MATRDDQNLDQDLQDGDPRARYAHFEERVRQVRAQRALLDAQVADLLDARREAARDAKLLDRFEARVLRLEERLGSIEKALRVYP